MLRIYCTLIRLLWSIDVKYSAIDYTAMTLERMTITMTPELRKKLERIAKKEHRSESAMIHYLIDKYQD